MSSRILRKLEDFLQCSICLDQFKKPKILPCRHRYCCSCLNQLFAKHLPGGKFYCPICSYESIVPLSGAEFLQNDFLTNSLIDLVQLEENLTGQGEIRECGACSKTTTVAAYCPDCNGFVCDDCHNKHKTFNFLKGHVKMVYLKDVESGRVQIDLERLSALSLAPRCQTHPDMILHLNCKTCGNQQICPTCSQVRHQGHVLEEIKDAASRLKMELKGFTNESKELIKPWQKQTNEIEKCIREVTDKVYLTTKAVEQMVSEKLIGIQNDTTSKEQELQTEIQSVETDIQRRKEELQRRLLQLDNEKERKIKEIEGRRNISGTITGKKKQDLDEEQRVLLEQIEQQRLSLSKHFSDIQSKVDSILARHSTCFQSVLHAMDIANNWSAVQIIPDQCAALKSLNYMMRTEFSTLQISKDYCLSLRPLSSSYLGIQLSTNTGLHNANKSKSGTASTHVKLSRASEKQEKPMERKREIKGVKTKGGKDVSKKDAKTKKSKLKRKLKVKKDPNAPKKPLSAYVIFCGENRSLVRSKNPSWSMTEVQTQLGMDWKSLSDANRTPFNEKLVMEKERYKREMEIYTAGQINAAKVQEDSFSSSATNSTDSDDE